MDINKDNRMKLMFSIGTKILFDKACLNVVQKKIEQRSSTLQYRFYVSSRYIKITQTLQMALKLIFLNRRNVSLNTITQFIMSPYRK